MSNEKLIKTLVEFGEGNIKVLGKKHGGAYLRRCFQVWQGKYGEAVAAKVREKLIEAWKSHE